MPYIKQEERWDLNNQLLKLSMSIETLGQFTYVIYVLSLKFLQHMGISYANYASILGALTCTLQELYRKEVSVYEDEKELQNGSIKI